MQHSNGLELGIRTKLAEYWTGLYLNMKQKLWILALILALLKTQLDFFHGGMEGDRALETQRAASISTRINHHATSQSPARGSWNTFLATLWKSLT